MALRTIIVCSKDILDDQEKCKNVPIMVFLHGFCGSGALFYKIFKEMSQNVCLVLVDLIGMGGSDHPEDFDRNTGDLESVIQYFVDYLELWREKISKSRIMK